jgi:FkbM family methyltransferase
VIYTFGVLKNKIMLLDFNKLIEKYDLKINGVIHIGAHVGQEHNLYKMNNVKNIVYFEPLNQNFSKLKENVGNEAILFNCALGNKTGEVEMFVETVNMGQSSSILEPDVHKKQYPHIVFNKKEKVKIDKLDNVDIDFKKYNLINIDVQGYELEVFKGAINHLKNNVDYIISEINREELYKNCSKINELKDFLSEFGFELVEESWDGLTWGDGFFIKKIK